MEHSSSCFDTDLFVFRRTGGRVLGLESTLMVTQTLHKIFLRSCPEPVPEWLSGHRPDRTPSESPHLAFFPLAHVASSHADGHLLGVAAALPRDLDEEERARCLRYILFDRLGEPNSLHLKMGRLGEWQIELDERESRPLALQRGTWIGRREARHWATVTPVALDRHPKGNGPEKWTQIEESIRRACARIHLPLPKEIVLSEVSMFEGAPHVREFPNIRRNRDQGKIFHIHVLLIFEEPVRGPILLGAGRYRGYGLCRPLYE